MSQVACTKAMKRSVNEGWSSWFIHSGISRESMLFLLSGDDEEELGPNALGPFSRAFTEAGRAQHQFQAKAPGSHPAYRQRTCGLNRSVCSAIISGSTVGFRSSVE